MSQIHGVVAMETVLSLYEPGLGTGHLEGVRLTECDTWQLAASSSLGQAEASDFLERLYRDRCMLVVDA
jgi:hypothetical protein